LTGIVGGLLLEVLMMRVGIAGGLRPSEDYTWGDCEPFYGTRVGPGWYQTGTSVPRVRYLPFSVLRMLIRPSPQSPRREGRRQSTLRRPASAMLLRRTGV